jgi:hypothetical protein
MNKHIPLHRGFINFNNEMKDHYYWLPRLYFERHPNCNSCKLIMLYFRWFAFRFYCGYYYKYDKKGYDKFSAA